MSLRRTGSLLLFVAVLAVLACGEPTRKPGPPPASAALGGEVVARVGDVTIERSLVASVAAAQHVSARVALDRLIDDALAAEGARQRGLDATRAVGLARRTARARFVADRIHADAAARGLPSDDEVAMLTARHWQSFDVPESLRVVHAVVMRTAAVPAERGAEVAAGLRNAVVDAADAKDFEIRARAADPHGLEVRVETLPAFVRDGRMVQGGGLDPTFVAAAFALPQPGSTSAVVETKFGWHVIRVLERIPPKVVPLEQRRATFAEEIIFVRGLDAKQAIVDGWKKTAPVSIDRNADTWMAEAVSAVVQ